MKAVVYNGPRDVAVTDVDDARIERPSDAIARITTTNICGSALHMYEGRTDFEPGRTFGHENLGQVVEVVEDVERLQVGDWVCLPFHIACGKCVNCNRGLTNYCIEASRCRTWRAPRTASRTWGRTRAQGNEIPYDTLNKLVSSVRFTGGIGVVAVFVPEDPGSPDEFEKQGRLRLRQLLVPGGRRWAPASAP